MLVLTRKIDEEIRIGQDIRIKVLGIRGGSIRLGIEAPADLKILRRELEPTREIAITDDSRSVVTSPLSAVPTSAAGKRGSLRQPRAQLVDNQLAQTSPLACFMASRSYRSPSLVGATAGL
jgi:carbon storage regulator CsrA